MASALLRLPAALAAVLYISVAPALAAAPPAKNPYAGAWQFEYSGGDSGGGRVSVDDTGTVTGSGRSTEAGIEFVLAGHLASNGEMAMAATTSGEASTGSTFTGRAVNDKGSGTWDNAEVGVNGPLTARRPRSAAIQTTRFLHRGKRFQSSAAVNPAGHGTFQSTEGPANRRRQTMKEPVMRARLLALGLGTLVMTLPAANAMAHDGWWQHERSEYQDEDRGDYGRHGRHDRDDRHEQYERYRALQARYQANLARYDHELREGDWRAAQELREQLRCDEEALYRSRW